MPTEPRWYIVQTNVREEVLARSSMRAEGLDVYLPMMIKRNRKGETYGSALFPGYLFTRLSIGAVGWSKVYSSRGVKCVLGTGGRPTCVATRIIDEIKARETEGFIQLGLAEPARFKPGQAVTVSKGPFARLDAIFVEAVDKRRCHILIQLLGDSQRIATAELAHIE